MSKYKLDVSTNTLYYKKSESDVYITVPKINERETIIEKPHLLSHLISQSTFQRIKDNIFELKWNLMCSTSIIIV